jgi:hypothetical protein
VGSGRASLTGNSVSIVVGNWTSLIHRYFVDWRDGFWEHEKCNGGLQATIS